MLNATELGDSPRGWPHAAAPAPPVQIIKTLIFAGIREKGKAAPPPCPPPLRHACEPLRHVTERHCRLERRRSCSVTHGHRGQKEAEGHSLGVKHVQTLGYQELCAPPLEAQQR